MNEEMRTYQYIQEISKGIHLIKDTYIQAMFPNKVALKVAEETDLGIKLKGLNLKILTTYPKYLKK